MSFHDNSCRTLIGECENKRSKKRSSVLCGDRVGSNVARKIVVDKLMQKYFKNIVSTKNVDGPKIVTNGTTSSSYLFLWLPICVAALLYGPAV